MDEVKCTLCQADFRASAIEEVPAGVPKCPQCVRDYPGALTRAEILVENKNEAESLSEARVKVIVYEILEEAGLVRHKCEKCHAMFFRRKTMQVTCEKCGGLTKVEDKKEEKKKETK